MGLQRCVGLVLAAVVLAALPLGAQAELADTLTIVKDGDVPSNADIAVALAEATPFGTGGRVIISRDDAFADAMASGVMQDDAPLLLLPSQGPVPDGVTEQISRLSASEAVILGGEAAVSAEVEADLASMGLSTSRRAGASRFETALGIAAADAPIADTVLLARAFPSPGAADPSQGFADSIAAGGLSAENGWPILLTQTEVLTGPTRDYLTGATDLGQTRPTRVMILGGTAAVSQDVEDELVALGFDVERVAGASRADTALSIAKAGGVESAAEVLRVLVVDGTGENAWAGGFAAAAHSAAFDAPILLAAGNQLPPETEQFLADGIGGDPTAAPVLTCVVTPRVCEDTRRAAQLPPSLLGSLTGTRDSGFGNNGLVTLDNVVGLSVSASANGVVTLLGSTPFPPDGPDGQSPPRQLAAARFDTRGAPVSTFGEGGQTFLPTEADIWGGHGVVLPDGRSLIGGDVQQPDGRRVAHVTMLTPTGSLDTGFGANGRLLLDVLDSPGPTAVDEMVAFGEIVTVIVTDMNFGDLGAVTLDLADPAAPPLVHPLPVKGIATDAWARPDGAVVVGVSENFDTGHLVQLRNGAVDTSWGDGGVISGGGQNVLGIVMTEAGDVIEVFGPEAGGRSVYLSVLLPNGDYDPARGAELTFPADLRVVDVIEEPGVGFLVLGYVTDPDAGLDVVPRLHRFVFDGALDTAFGDGGTLTLDDHTVDYFPRHMAFDRAGRLLVVSNHYPANGSISTVHRVR